jgi:hypothetical protein
MVQLKARTRARALLVLVLAACATPSATSARPVSTPPERTRAVLAPLETAATECFATAILANPRARTHAEAGRWYQAAGVMGVICQREVDAIVRTSDRLLGVLGGQLYFKNVYVKRLDRDLAARLHPWLESKSVASAGLMVDPSSAATAE